MRRITSGHRASKKKKKKKKRKCRGKRRHSVMEHPPTHHTHTVIHTRIRKKKKVSPTSIKNKSSRSSRNIYTIKNGRGGNTKHDTCFLPSSKRPSVLSMSGRLATLTTKVQPAPPANTAAIFVTSAACRETSRFIFYKHMCNVPHKASLVG